MRCFLILLAGPLLAANFCAGPSFAEVSPVNFLEGKPLRYLIGADGVSQGRDDEVTVSPYDAGLATHGISIGYCNLFDENNTRRYGPYLNKSDTAAQYNEGQIDPRGRGWDKNLREQFERRKKQGFAYIELDNADAYAIQDVIGAIELAGKYDLKVVAKNPALLSNPRRYVAHSNVVGIIVERGAGDADEMDRLRRQAGKPMLPVWFVAFGNGRSWAVNIAATARTYHNMGVTYSSDGEYGNSIDIVRPIQTEHFARRRESAAQTDKPAVIDDGIVVGQTEQNDAAAGEPR